MKNYFYFENYSNEYIHFGVTSYFWYPNNDWDTQITYPYKNLLTLERILEKASQIKGYQVKEEDLVNIIFDDDIRPYLKIVEVDLEYFNSHRNGGQLSNFFLNFNQIDETSKIWKRVGDYKKNKQWFIYIKRYEILSLFFLNMHSLFVFLK